MSLWFWVVFLGVFALLFRGVRKAIWSRVVFPLLYTLYANTRVGGFIHSRQLASCAGKPPHSRCGNNAIHSLPGFTVVDVPFLEDNYCYIVIDHATGASAWVDPGDPQAALTRMQELIAEYKSGTGSAEYLKELTAAPRPTHIFVTHKHMDHSWGVKRLLEQLPGLRVVAPHGEGVKLANEFCHDGDVVQLGSTRITAISTPCHTSRHMCFHASSEEGGAGSRVIGEHGGTEENGEEGGGAAGGGEIATGAVFTGDCLFVAGTGKFFEGHASEMLDSLAALKKLPNQTLVFPGHEYSLDNLRFAAWAVPNHAPITAKLDQAMRQRQRRMPTIPSTIGSEKATNPFFMLRPNVTLTGHIPPGNSRASRVAILAALRGAKDAGLHNQA